MVKHYKIGSLVKGRVAGLLIDVKILEAKANNYYLVEVIGTDLKTTIYYRDIEA